MRRTLLSDLAARDNARVALTLTETDEEGNPVVIRHESRGEAVRSLEGGLTDRQRKHRAWKRHPLCHECGAKIESANQCGVFAVDGADRVAHKRICFVRCIARVNPLFSRTSAIVRSEVSA